MARIETRTRADGTIAYRVVFRITGKSAPTSETFNSPETAKAFSDLVDKLGGAAARKIRDSSVRPGQTSFSDYASQYITNSTSISPGTRGDYRAIHRKWLSSHFDALPIGAIDRDAVNAWLRWAQQQPAGRGDGTVSTKTLRNVTGLLSQILEDAVQTKHADVNHAHGLKIVDTGATIEAVFLTRDEFDLVLSCATDFHKPALQMLAASGMRAGELTALKWKDIETNGTVWVHKAWKRGEDRKRYQGTVKTKRSKRMVAIPPATLAMLGARGRPEEYVFRNRLRDSAVTVNSLSCGWRRAVEKAQAKDESFIKQPRLHDIRHSHASWLVGAGVPLNVVQARLGHESITTTVNRYTHLLPDAQSQALAALQGM